MMNRQLSISTQVNQIKLPFLFHFILRITGIVLLFLSIVSPLYSSISIGPFAGISGTSVGVFFAEYVLETDGAIVETAGKYGLLTGEAGAILDFNLKYIGLRFEALAGYYKYRVFDLPNTAYVMYMAGAEPYVVIGENGEGILFGCGGGVFYGYLWDEILGYEVSTYRNHRGYAVWGTVGYRSRIFEINARVRYHRFTEIDERKLEEYEGEDYNKFADDYVFILRFSILLNII